MERYQFRWLTVSGSSESGLVSLPAKISVFFWSQAFLKAWTPHRIFPPGQVPAYSNYATALMGYVIQRVSGERFEDYVERHIFGPLGMEHATFRQPLPDQLKKDMARGYQVGSGEAKQIGRAHV